MMVNVKGDIVKRYMHRDKMVVIAKIEGEKKTIYTFVVTSKANKKDYFSNEYDTFEQCERDSYKVAKGV